MSDFNMNFAQMAAMFGMFGNPAMANPLAGLGGGSGIQGLLGGAAQGIQGLIGGAEGAIQGIENMLGLGGQQQAPQQQTPQDAQSQEISQLQNEVQQLQSEIQSLTGGQGAGQQGGNPFGAGLGQGFDPFGQQGQGSDPFAGLGGGSPFGQQGSNPFGSGMNPFTNPFGAGLGQPGGLPYGAGFADPTQQTPWTVTNTGNGQDHIDLGNYTLDLNKANMQWTLTNKQTGDTTNISGDPHVSENGNKWDFKNNLSFQLDDGTKITVHTIPYGNGQNVSSELDITNGSHGMKVTGLGGNLDAGGLQVSDGLNGYALDAANAGTPEIYEAAGNWQTFDGTNITQQVSQQDGL